MSKTTKTSIPATVLNSAMEKLGYMPEEQKGFVKYDLGDSKRIYVARTALVTRVDFSGFTPELDEEQMVAVEDNGRVKWGLRFEGPAAEILEAFIDAVKSAEHCAAYPKTVAKRGTKAADPKVIEELEAKLASLLND